MMHTRRFRNPQAPLAYADNLLLLARISNASLRNLLAPLDSQAPLRNHRDTEHGADGGSGTRWPANDDPGTGADIKASQIF